MRNWILVLFCGCALLLSACGTEKLYQGQSAVTQIAIIRGDLKVPDPKGEGQVFLESVDGVVINPNNNRAAVDPGQHTIGIRCQIPAKQISVKQTLSFQVFAARVYQLKLHESGNSCRGSVIDLAAGQQVAG